MILSLTRMRRGKGPALALLAALFVLLAFDAPVWAAQRVALVIGNSAYRKVPQLSNPVRDAKAIAAVLRRMGYEVSLKTDLDYDGMRKALRAFSRQVTRADVAVLYFAGHGMEAKGVNYLIPVDAELKDAADLDFEAISLKKALHVVERARKLKVVMLDACRDNPFVARMQMANGQTRSVARGLARVEPEGSGVLVAYAARAGSTADDGDGEHSPFTEALLKNLPTPGLDVRLLFGKVKDDVRRATGARQEPFIYGSLGGGTLALMPGDGQVAAAAPSPAPVPPQAPAAGEDEGVAFQRAVAQGTMDAYEGYLRKFPHSDHAAKVRALAAMLADGQAWKRARSKDSIAGYQSYLIVFPQGAYAAQARRRVAALQDALTGEGRGGAAQASQGSQPGDLRAAILSFVRREWMQEGRTSHVVRRDNYAPYVTYYGKHGVPRGRIMKDKARYFRRWPYASYKVDAGTLEIRPAAGPGRYQVSFEYDYEVASSKKSSAGRGLAQLTLEVASGGFRIVSEGGRVLRKY